MDGWIDEWRNDKRMDEYLGIWKAMILKSKVSRLKVNKCFQKRMRLHWWCGLIQYNGLSVAGRPQYLITFEFSLFGIHSLVLQNCRKKQQTLIEKQSNRDPFQYCFLSWISMVGLLDTAVMLQHICCCGGKYLFLHSSSTVVNNLFLHRRTKLRQSSTAAAYNHP